MTIADGTNTAKLDPWCTVILQNGTKVLFGFALVHPATGGLSWMSSSKILELDIPEGRARTTSGRNYNLGRQFECEQIYYEGEEAEIAFELLLGRDIDDQGNTSVLVLDRFADGNWVTACKVARHIGIEPPRRIPSEVGSFLSQYGEAYLRIRAFRRAF